MIDPMTAAMIAKTGVDMYQGIKGSEDEEKFREEQLKLMEEQQGKGRAGLLARLMGQEGPTRRQAAGVPMPEIMMDESGAMGNAPVPQRSGDIAALTGATPPDAPVGPLAEQPMPTSGQMLSMEQTKVPGMEASQSTGLETVLASSGGGGAPPPGGGGGMDLASMMGGQGGSMALFKAMGMSNPYAAGASLIAPSVLGAAGKALSGESKKDKAARKKTEADARLAKAQARKVENKEKEEQIRRGVGLVGGPLQMLGALASGGRKSRLV